jgi:hypothetical protein
MNRRCQAHFARFTRFLHAFSTPGEALEEQLSVVSCQWSENTDQKGPALQTASIVRRGRVLIGKDLPSRQAALAP